MMEYWATAVIILKSGEISSLEIEDSEEAAKTLADRENDRLHMLGNLGVGVAWRAARVVIEEPEAHAGK